MFDIFILIVGTLLLVGGGDLLVRGAISVAEKYSVSPLIIGLTIVSMGTSAPEMFISVRAAIEGSGGLAIGNVMGSNIANILLVLGLPAIFTVIKCDEKGIGRNLVFLLIVTLIFLWMLSKPIIGWGDGLILLAFIGIFLIDQFRTAKKAAPEDIPDYHDDISTLPESNWKIALSLIVGIVLLPLGADLMVRGATQIALNLGVSHAVIGLTLVAFATSLPELATSMIAVFRGSSNVALGNVVGSNIFNIGAIMGVTALVAPLETGDDIISIDRWVLLGATLLLIVIAKYIKRLSFVHGIFMLSAYTAYIVMAFM